MCVRRRWRICSGRWWRERQAERAASAVDIITCHRFDGGDDIVANLSIRGLDDKALAALKRRAAKEASSVNTLVVRLVEQGLGLRRARTAMTRHDDLDALAGSWRKQEAADFERATAALRKVDPALWK